MKPYIVCDGVSLDDLLEGVAGRILEGYVPIGGVFFMFGNPCQAMVLRDLSGWIDSQTSSLVSKP